LAASSFRWSDFLGVANKLQLGGDEASLRTAVSRAYYVAFHAAKGYVERTQGAFHRRSSEHDQTWTALSSSGDAEEATIGQWGSDLCRLRINADYKLQKSTQSREALQALSYARKIREGLGKLAGKGD